MPDNFTRMSRKPTAKPVERLFPFALRAAIVIPGRDALRRMRRRLLFLLVTTDLSENSREAVRRDFAGLPLIERYTAADLERFFNLRNTKVVGFKKSALAQSILVELRAAPPPAAAVFPESNSISNAPAGEA